jgi:hypothetical protein
LRQSPLEVHSLRHRASGPHTSGGAQVVPLEHEVSRSSWQTLTLPDDTQCSPWAQSRVCSHSMWHRPKVQTRFASQSLLSLQGAARFALLPLELHPAAIAPRQASEARPAENRLRKKEDRRTMGGPFGYQRRRMASAARGTLPNGDAASRGALIRTRVIGALESPP